MRRLAQGTEASNLMVARVAQTEGSVILVFNWCRKHMSLAMPKIIPNWCFVGSTGGERKAFTWMAATSKKGYRRDNLPTFTVWSWWLSPSFYFFHSQNLAGNLKWDINNTTNLIFHMPTGLTCAVLQLADRLVRRTQVNLSKMVLGGSRKDQKRPIIYSTADITYETKVWELKCHLSLGRWEARASGSWAYPI